MHKIVDASILIFMKRIGTCSRDGNVQITPLAQIHRMHGSIGLMFTKWNSLLTEHNFYHGNHLSVRN